MALFTSVVGIYYCMRTAKIELKGVDKKAAKILFDSPPTELRTKSYLYTPSSLPFPKGIFIE